MDIDIDALISAANEDFSNAQSIIDLENAKAKYLGKSGVLKEYLKKISSLSDSEKKTQGAAINKCKNSIERLLQSSRKSMEERNIQAELRSEYLDITLPGQQRRGCGGVHPISKTIERIENIFHSIGFDVADGPEIETDWHCFTALNNPDNHPARSMQDTFYIESKDEYGRNLCLRPHTSAMQVRYAQEWVNRNGSQLSDIRVLVPGKTYRVDNDSTHSPMFHQCEGLWLGDNISFKDLKFVLSEFFKIFFETDELKLRFRPSYFPFTQPSAEVDVAFMAGSHKGKWLEVAGAGQVHPNVVKNFGLDPENAIGFAFGIGPDRLTMLKYGVDDLRMFFEGDVRFIKQFQ